MQMNKYTAKATWKMIAPNRRCVCVNRSVGKSLMLGGTHTSLDDSDAVVVFKAVGSVVAVSLSGESVVSGSLSSFLASAS